ncbi:hypothetical protein JTB14_018941 [Gonioctena quinquepunctata]|nr:hypothetical protein JTB14_018941 [Gonioctena quinquepunctata]
MPIPKGSTWLKFLSDSNNEQDSFNFLSEKFAELTAGASYQLFTTKDNQVLSNRTSDISTMSPSHQREADIRMTLHLHTQLSKGMQKRTSSHWTQTWLFCPYITSNG